MRCTKIVGIRVDGLFEKETVDPNAIEVAWTRHGFLMALKTRAVPQTCNG